MSEEKKETNQEVKKETNEAKSEPSKIGCFGVFIWFVGLILLLIGITQMFQFAVLNFIGGLINLIAGFLMLPPTRKTVENKLNIKLSNGASCVAVFIMFVVGIAIMPKPEIRLTDRTDIEQKETIKTENDVITEEKDLTKQAELEKQNQKEEAEEQAKKEAEEKANNVPAEYKSALKKAGSYANIMHMSKQGVYDQLVSDYGGQFSAEAAQYAIDNVEADWNANALAKAKDYQDIMSMSPAAIHDQLTSQYGGQFTQTEADYAIDHLND